MVRISYARYSCASTRASSLTPTDIPQRGAGNNARTGRIVNLCMTLVALMAAGGSVSTTRGQTIYYSDDSGLHEGIHRVLANGKNLQNLIATVGVHDIALDVDAGKMYWLNRVNIAIKRANLDGSNVEDLVTTDLFVPFGIALDPTGGKVYWTDVNPLGDWIRRANLDGSSAETLVTGGFPNGIDLDIAAGKMYWTNQQGPGIRRANLDGSNVVLAAITEGVPWALALDVAGEKIYWTVPVGGDGQIWRVNFSGAARELLVEIEGGDPLGIALDVAGGKMYWTDHELNQVSRANLDGSNVEIVIAKLTNDIFEDAPVKPWAIAIQFTVCGDGVVEGAETCDDGGESASCDADCTFVECGDGTLNTTAGEECDDGPDNSNTEPDACRTTCVPASCGDGVADTGEACDDGNNSNEDSCLNDCEPNVCGDGFLNIGVEECDDGNLEPGDGCDENCRFDLGACCLDDTCFIASESDCFDSGGTFQGLGSSCGGVEGCCDSDTDACYLADRICCLANGDTPQGPGSTCNTTCGDGTCDCGEDQDNCCTDCGCSSCTHCDSNQCVTDCGDGTCDAGCGEDCDSCPSDCGCPDCTHCFADCSGGDRTCVFVCVTDCGDGTCDPACENCFTCEDDCGCGVCTTCNTATATCDSDCGNGVCQPLCFENCRTCLSDCQCGECENCSIGGGCISACGDGTCDPACETCSSCPQDCHACGDGCCTASAGENCCSCTQDCGPCCGNGVCDNLCGEDCSTCPSDCELPEGEECMPTMSEWGLMILILALLTGIAIKFGLRRRPSCG